jgi:hypothetical protein
MSQVTQLSLFGAAAAAISKPVKKAQPSSTGLTVEPSNDDYLSVCLRGVWVGSLRALSRTVFCLYFPGERGVCGFGGPSVTKAALELLKCYARDGKEVPRG